MAGVLFWPTIPASPGWLPPLNYSMMSLVQFRDPNVGIKTPTEWPKYEQSDAKCIRFHEDFIDVLQLNEQEKVKFYEDFYSLQEK